MVKITETDIRNTVKSVIREMCHENNDNSKLKKFLDNLTKEELKEASIDYRNIWRVATYSNPLSYRMGKNLNEGLIRTYPIDKTISYVKSYFKLHDEQIRTIEGENGVSLIVVYVPAIYDNIEKVEKALSLCGYFLNHSYEENTEFGKWVRMQFEPMFIRDDTESIKKDEDKLLHLTLLYNIPRIKNIGLSPRSKNEVFKYPNRIYLLRGSMPKQEIKNIGKQLRDSNTNIMNNGEYVLLTIDINTLPDNVQLYTDPMYEYGIFTSSNIPPNCIVDAERINFN